MTQDEVDLIYAHLHEHYRYHQGELIVIKDVSSKQKIGDKAGHFLYSRRSGHPVDIVSIPLRVLNRKSSLSMAHCVYIYHHKIKPRFIAYIDGNPVNTQIENLICEEKRNLCYRDINYSTPPKGLTLAKLKCADTYYVRSERNGKSIYIGRYLDKDIGKLAYDYLRELLFDHNLSLIEIEKMVKNKFPVPYKKTNKIGFTGVRKYGQKYTAYITIQKEKINLGRFDTAQEAHEAYLKAKNKHKT
jgi:hypothetical protein